jgi:Ca-activated chloride channel homolog
MNFKQRRTALIRRLALTLALSAALLSTLHAVRARQTPNTPAQNARTTAPSNDTTTTASDLVLVNVAVTDKTNNLVTGLTREAFSVFDGKSRREIVSFSAADAPATVGVLLDASGSMSGDREKGNLVRVRNSLLRFFRGCHERDEFFLIAFNQSAQLLLDMSNDSAVVLDAIDRFAAGEPKGQTALYDALYLALDRAARGKHTMRALVVVTDGEDNVSKFTFKEVRQAVKESDVIVYAVVLVDPLRADPHLVANEQVFLQEITELSGGAAFYAKNDKELNAVMIQIAAELRNRYTLAFVPDRPARGDGWHDLKIKLGELRDQQGKKVKPVLRARPGFYDETSARR